MPTLRQNLLAEFFGTMFLIIAAIGSTILATSVLHADLALSIFINAIAVVFTLFALIETFGSVSGSHFNPAVTLALFLTKDINKVRRSTILEHNSLVVSLVCWQPI